MGAVIKALAASVPVELGAARVVAVVDASTLEVVRRNGRTLQATVVDAESGSYREGDTVLVATGSDGEHFVLGSLGAKARTQDGTRADVEHDDKGEVLRVRDVAGTLLFEYRVAERASVVHAPEGDLSFVAERGAIKFSARDGVAVKTDGEVSFDAARAVRVSTPHLEAVANRAEVSADVATVTARAITTTAEKARALIGVIETTATRIVERARNAYRETEELSQTKAGRMRTIVKQTYQLLGKRTLLRAEQDMRVDGEKIYLG